MTKNSLTLNNLARIIKFEKNSPAYNFVKKTYVSTYFYFTKASKLTKTFFFNTRPADLSFSHILLSLFLIIVFLILSEKLFSRVLRRFKCRFFKKYYSFAFLYIINWIFVVSLFSSSPNSWDEFIRNMSLNDFSQIVQSLALTIIFITGFLVVIYILPFLVKYLIAIIPIGYGLYHAANDPSNANILLLGILTLLGILLMLSLRSFFKNISKDIHSVIVLIFKNFHLIFTFSFLIFSILFVKIFILQFLFVNVTSSSLYYMYLTFTLLWSCYVSSYAVSTIAFSILIDSRKSSIYNKQHKSKVKLALISFFDSFGLICFYSLIPALFDILVSILESLNGSLKPLQNNLAFYLIKKGLELSIALFNALSKFIFSYNYYTLLMVTLLNKNVKSEDELKKYMPINLVSSFSALKFVRSVINCMPVIYLTKSIFLEQSISFKSLGTMSYTMFISYFIIEAIFSLIEPTYLIIINQDIVKKDN